MHSGFQHLSIADPVFGGTFPATVQYPSTVPPAGVTLHGVTWEATLDAPLAPGRFPVCVISHGAGGCGTPVGLHLAMQAPDRVCGLVIQNGNAHRTGLSSQWDPVLAYASQPTPEIEAQATAHLNFEGTRGTYLSGVPPDVAARMSAECWDEDWRVMQLPGRLDKERALIADYGRYVAQFDVIAAYLARWQPPALLIWGRHDPFFELAEVLSWMQDLPRMDAHVLDAGHMLLETHAAEAASLMVDFIRRTQARPEHAR